MEWIDVVDSAVKIGLGAAISGLATYLVTRHNHSREREKILYVRRLDSLESVSDKMEEHFEAWRRMASKLGGIYSGRNRPAPDFSNKQWNEIIARDKELLATRDSLNHSIARLRLLSAGEAAACLSEYSKTLGDFRDELILQRTTPSQEEFNVVRKNLRESIATFHEEMSKTYHSKTK